LQTEDNTPEFTNLLCLCITCILSEKNNLVLIPWGCQCIATKTGKISPAQANCKRRLKKQTDIKTSTIGTAYLRAAFVIWWVTADRFLKTSAFENFTLTGAFGVCDLISANKSTSVFYHTIISQNNVKSPPIKLHACNYLNQGFSTPLGVHLPIWRGTFRVSNRSENYILFIPKYLYMYQRILFSKIITVYAYC